MVVTTPARACCVSATVTRVRSAIGDVLRDQLFYMRRCGFDAFAIRADRDPVDALEGLATSR